MSDYASRKVTIRRWRNLPPPRVGAGWVETEVKVDLEINWERLFDYLGGKALGNKTRRCRVLGGLIKAKVFNLTSRS